MNGNQTTFFFRNMSTFVCSYNTCLFHSTSFRRFIIHTWDKHSVSANFSHVCHVSGCTKRYTNQQSFLRHLKSKHQWYYDTHYPTRYTANENENNNANDNNNNNGDNNNNVDDDNNDISM